MEAVETQLTDLDVTAAGGPADDFLADLEGLEEPSGEMPTGGKGNFPPTLRPGTYRGIFKLAPVADALGKVVRQGREYLNCKFNIFIDHAGIDGKQFTREPKFPDTEIRYNEANAFRTANMKSSRLEDLFFALGGKPAGAHATNAEIVATLRAADGQTAVMVDVGWRASVVKGVDDNGRKTYDEVSTFDKRHTAWPKAADGSHELQVKFANGESKYGQLQVIRVRRARS